MPTVNLPSDLYASVGTTVEQDLGVVVDRTDDGASAIRDLYADAQYNITARFSVVTQAQQNSLRAFFWNYRTSEIIMDLNGVSYAGYIIGPIKTGFDYGAGLASVEVSLRAREVV